MSTKFEVRICSCGRIHFIDNKLIDEALKEDKALMVVCGGCGTIQLIGADRCADWDDPEKTVFNMFTYTIRDEQKIWDASLFTGTDGMRAISKILYNEGVRVLMKSGYFAKSFEHGVGRFQDMWYPDFWKIPANATAEEYREFIANWQKDSVTVNMQYLLKTLTDEQAKALSGYAIEGLNWIGTEYEQEWHR